MKTKTVLLALALGTLGFHAQADFFGISLSGSDQGVSSFGLSYANSDFGIGVNAYSPSDYYSDWYAPAPYAYAPAYPVYNAWTPWYSWSPWVPWVGWSAWYGWGSCNYYDNHNH